jgi:threonine synthase
MDVGHPSNMERMRDLFPALDALREGVTAVSVDDDAIRSRTQKDRRRFGETWCPHTAVAAEAWALMSTDARRAQAWCLVSTASPAKFPEIVEPLIETTVPIPATLARLFERPSRFDEIDASLEALREALQ